MTSFFPDVNVWFALAVVEHFHHQQALAWWEECSEEIAFCRFTQMGLLRLLTTAAMMRGRPLGMKAAWSTLDLLASDSRVRLEPEPALLEQPFRLLTASSEASPKLWMDFYLQAFAEATDSTLITFDRGLASRCPAARLLA